MDAKVIQKFESYTVPEPNTGCWLWTSYLTHNGYGIFFDYNPSLYNTKTRKKFRAHRFSYMAFKGDIPKGMFVCHTCDVRSCVNPDHLYLGTPQDNMDDMMRRGRGKQGGKPQKHIKNIVYW